MGAFDQIINDPKLLESFGKGLVSWRKVLAPLKQKVLIRQVLFRLVTELV